jgi:hypothetical protein
MLSETGTILNGTFVQYAAATVGAAPDLYDRDRQRDDAPAETMMIWQLLQVRHLSDAPLILVGRMWPGLVEWARASMLATDPPLASPEDMSIPRCVASGDEAIAVIRQHHERWLRGQAG